MAKVEGTTRVVPRRPHAGTRDLEGGRPERALVEVAYLHESGFINGSVSDRGSCHDRHRRLRQGRRAAQQELLQPSRNGVIPCCLGRGKLLDKERDPLTTSHDTTGKVSVGRLPDKETQHPSGARGDSRASSITSTLGSLINSKTMSSTGDADGMLVRMVPANISLAVRNARLR